MADRLIYLDEGLPGLPEDLMLARDRGNVLFLTGAGVSAPAPSSLPNFQGLVCEIAKRLDGRLGQAMHDLTQLDRSEADFSQQVEHLRPELDPRQCAEFNRFASGEYDMVLGMLERRMARASEAVTSGGGWLRPH